MPLTELCRQWKNFGNLSAEVVGKSGANIEVWPTYGILSGEIKFSLLREAAMALHLALQDRDNFGD